LLGFNAATISRSIARDAGELLLAADHGALELAETEAQQA
jgi:hypothetical protein